MKQKDCIEFYRKIIKACPQVRDLTSKECYHRLGAVFETLHGITPTREHIMMALRAEGTNKIKRKWDLKKQYAVVCFLENPQATTGKVAKTLRDHFNQKTRSSVIDDARVLAEEMRRTCSKEDIEEFIQSVRQQIVSKSQDEVLIQM